MVRLIILCVLFAIPAVAWCQEPGSSSVELLTLEQAVSLAIENNRPLKNAKLEVEKSENQVSAARTQLLPTFDFSLLESKLLTPIDFEFKRGSLGTFPSTGPIPAEDTKISTPRRLNTFIIGRATQPLSQLYRIWLGIRLRGVSKEIAQEELRLQRQSVVNNVKRAYYGILQTLSALEATQESVKFYRELDRLMAKYVEQKVALKYEGLDVKAQLAKEEYNALQLRDSLATQKEQLNDLMGRDIRTEFSVSPVLEPTMVEVDLAAAQAHALEQRPDLKEAQLKIDQAEYDKRIKKLEYIPDISFAFSYLSPLSIEFVPKNIASVGILLSWDIFDWGRKRQELAEKTKSIEQANNGLRETQSQVLIDVDNKFRKLQETRDLMRVTQLAQEAAREKLRVTMNKYKENKALLKDLLEAQVSLSEANNQYQQALSSFWTARADFEKALGKDE